MHLRNIIQLAGLLIPVLLADGLSAADSVMVPEIRAGEIVLCEPYPHRTVPNTSRTIYQMARLGFASVRTFQQTQGLKADGIIGPMTQRQVEVEFQRKFGQSASGSASDISLVVSIQPILTVTSVAATVSIRSAAVEPVRILGSLTYDERQGFRFVAPVVSLHTKTCLRRGDLVACGGVSASVELLPRGVEVMGSTTLPLLAAGESGRLHTSITYIDAALRERVAAADTPRPD